VRLGLLSLAFVLTLAAGVLVAVFLLIPRAPSDDQVTADLPPEASRQAEESERDAGRLAPAGSPAETPRSEVPPGPAERPAPLPVFASRRLAEAAGGLERSLLGKRVVVAGRVKRLGTTGLAQRLFKDVPEGLGFASLSDDPREDQAQVVCVFRGGCPAALAEGVPCRIEGTFRGVSPTSGVPLLTECDLAGEGR
jgi:hypothetical protein